MAHGAGGKATQSLIEGLFVPAFGGETLGELADAGEVAVDGVQTRAHDRLLRGQAAALPRRLDRRAGGQRHRQRPGRVRRPSARAEPLAGARGGARGRGAARRGRRDRAGRAGGGRRDRRGRHEGRRARPRRRDVHLHDRARQPRSARELSPPPTSGPATASCCRAASASTAWRSCSRAANSSWMPRSSPTRPRCGRRSTRCSTPPGPRCAACATPPAAAWPRCSTSWRAPPRWRCSCARAPIPVHPAVAGAAEILGIDPMYVANEGKLVAFVAPEAVGQCAGGAARGPRVRAGGGDRRGADGAAGDGAGARRASAGGG